MSFNRFAGRLAVVSFVGCLLVGLLVVGWRIRARADSLRTSAGVEAAAQATAIAAQLSQTVEAAQTLGILARQSGGTIPNFAKVGTELLTIWPGLDSVELEPGGIISDVAPRAGHERAIGSNALSDPAIRAIANAAVQRRSPRVAGPLLFSNGELGIVAREPVFQRGRDGRETLWGFAAASMRLTQALARARLGELPKRGFDYICFVPAAGQHRMVTIALHGSATAGDTVQQPIRVQNVELVLGLRPRSGWVNILKAVLDVMAVLVVSGLTGLLMSLLDNRQALEASLAELNRRLAGEMAARQQAQKDLRAAQDSGAAAQSRQAELDEARAALQQAQQTIADLEARAQTAARAEKETAASVLSRWQQDQATIADLQSHLDDATRSAREAAEASAATSRGLEAANEELKARLAKAEETGTQVAELEALLKEAREETARQKEALERVADVETTGPDEAGEKETKSPRSKKAAPTGEPAVEEEATVPVEAPSAAGGKGEKVAPVEAAQNESDLSRRPVAEGGSESGTGTPETSPGVVTPKEVPAAELKTPKRARRKKLRRDDQMDFFADRALENETANQPRVPTSESERDEAEAALPLSEPAAVVAKAPPEAQPKPGELAAEEAPPEPASKAARMDTEPQTETDSKAHPNEPNEFSRLAEKWAGTPEKIRDDLVQGDPAAARETADALKTAAGQAGAREIEEAAAALARAIQTQAEPDRIEFLWADLQKALSDLRAGDLETGSKPKDEKAKRARPLPAPPPVNPGQLRKAVNLIVPLLTDGDPGAKDCLKDNRGTFRSTFTSEGYVEFEQSVKGADYGVALEHLRKAVKKHGISV